MIRNKPRIDGIKAKTPKKKQKIIGVTHYLIPIILMENNQKRKAFTELPLR